MLQLYFLIIFCDAAAGLLLLYPDKFSQNKNFSLVLGTLSLLTGLLVLINPIADSPAIAGDLIPALCGIITGFLLLYKHFNSVKETNETEKNNIMILILSANQKNIAYISIIAAILHFILPKVMFI